MKRATVRTKETARGTRTASNGSRRPTGVATVSDRAFERTLTQRIAKDRKVLLALAGPYETPEGMREFGDLDIEDQKWLEGLFRARAAGVFLSRSARAKIAGARSDGG